MKFWIDECLTPALAKTEPSGKAVFGGIWLDHDRIVAVQPRPPFLPFFEEKRLRAEGYAGVNDGNDGGLTRTLPPEDGEIEVWANPPGH